MGHNIDLQWLMGLPKFIRCSRCKDMTPTCFDEYDVDCGSPQATNGIMSLSVQCQHCGFDNDFEVNISFKKPNENKT